MKIISDNDIKKLLKWAEARGLSVDPDFLSNKGYFGMHCGFFIYHDQSSKLGFFHGLISNPESKPKDVYFELKILIKTALKDCKIAGIRKIISHTSSRGLKKLIEKIGFNHVSSEYVMQAGLK